MEGSILRLKAPSDAALLDCCFQAESVAFSAGSDGTIRRLVDPVTKLKLYR